MSSRRTRLHLTAYFVLAFAISWAFMVPVALSAQGLIARQISPARYYLAPMGPMLSALLLEALTAGSKGWRRLLAGLSLPRVARKYLAFSVLAPAGLFLLAMLVDWIFTGAPPAWRRLGQVDYLPRPGVLGALGLWLLTFGLGEEMGWRGYALPRLQRSRSALSATMILGFIWALWHIPAFFFRDTYMSMGVLGFPMFLFSMLCASTVFTWLYNSTRGNILTVVLFHVLFDWLSVSGAGGEFAPILMSAGVIFWAFFVAQRHGLEALSPEGKYCLEAVEGEV